MRFSGTAIVAGLAAISFVLSAGAGSAYDGEFDYNGDGSVDQADLDILSDHLGLAVADDAYYARFDHDGDGFVGGTDLLLAQAAVAAGNATGN